MNMCLTSLLFKIIMQKLTSSKYLTCQLKRKKSKIIHKLADFFSDCVRTWKHDLWQIYHKNFMKYFSS